MNLLLRSPVARWLWLRSNTAYWPVRIEVLPKGHLQGFSSFFTQQNSFRCVIRYFNPDLLIPNREAKKLGFFTYLQSLGQSGLRSVIQRLLHRSMKGMSDNLSSKSSSSANQSAKGRSKWDAGRFLATIGYFGEVPFLGSFRWLQQLMDKNTVVCGIAMSTVKKVAVLGDVSIERQDALRQRLASDAELSLISSDTPLSEIGHLIRSVDVVAVLDSRFLGTYLSAVGQTGEETKNVDWLNVEQSAFDFTGSNGDTSAWGALDDVVMGGVSEGRLFLREQVLAQESATIGNPSRYAVFAGSVSTDNSGGFSSVRTRNFEPPFNFSGWAGIRLWIKGDGQRYKFILRNSSGWDSPAYIYSFDTLADEWQAVYVPFDEMVPTFRARSVPDAPKLDPQKVFSFQIMLSKFEYDKRLNPSFKPGPFELAIATLSAYRPRQGEPLLIVSDEALPMPELDKLAIGYRFAVVDSAASDDAYADAIAQSLPGLSS